MGPIWHSGQAACAEGSGSTGGSVLAHSATVTASTAPELLDWRKLTATRSGCETTTVAFCERRPRPGERWGDGGRAAASTW
jgi:hypothetical protein